MFRNSIRNRSFDWMGDMYAPVIDPDHFLGRSAFDIPWDTAKPAANLKKEDGRFALQIAVPGFSKEEIEVSLKGNTLIVKGEKSKSEEVKDENFVLSEFNMQKFERRFKLSRNLKKEVIEAECKNGILTVRFELEDAGGRHKPSRIIEIF